MHGCLRRVFASQGAKEKRGILEWQAESSELSAQPGPVLREELLDLLRSRIAPLGAPGRLRCAGTRQRCRCAGPVPACL